MELRQDKNNLRDEILADLLFVRLRLELLASKSGAEVPASALQLCESLAAAVRRLPESRFVFGDLLRQRRSQAQMSQPELAEQSGLSLSTVQNLEAGRAQPSLRTLLALSRIRALGLSFSADLGEPSD